MKHLQLLAVTSTFDAGNLSDELDYTAMEIPAGEAPDSIVAIRLGTGVGDSAIAHEVSFTTPVAPGHTKAGYAVATITPAPGGPDTATYRFLVLYQYSPLGDHADLI